MTNEQKESVLRLYANTKTQDLADMLGVEKHTVDNFAARQGLKKSAEYMAMDKLNRIKVLANSSRKHTYTKGNIPHNKGKKVKPETYEKMRKNFFKKGQKTHNEKYDGYERINSEGYMEVRISKKVFKLKHRLIWEQANGQIPKDHLLVFKDKNKMNCTLENLELVTKAENMLRNTIQNYPNELRQAFRLISKLNKKIQSYEKHD